MKFERDVAIPYGEVAITALERQTHHFIAD
jgi:hypothetical protein